ncbi:MAG TPA: P-II family nitrogen regulator [Nitrososphaeraceae archaeon]|nr:P-II family nitrogen regulator [Nitrososphaeraceae archaeon]
MIKIDIVISQNDIKAVSDALKTINVGGVTVSKVKGRGKSVVPQLHASKGTGMYTPEFGDKYKLEVVLPDNKENDAIDVIRKNTKIGKIFIWPVARAIDIESGVENELAI